MNFGCTPYKTHELSVPLGRNSQTPVPAAPPLRTYLEGVMSSMYRGVVGGAGRMGVRERGGSSWERGGERGGGDGVRERGQCGSGEGETDDMWGING